MTDKLCKDCVHNREGAHYDYCSVEFIKSTCGLKISNKFASCDARYNNCLCGASAKHFEAKDNSVFDSTAESISRYQKEPEVEYEYLDKFWERWEKEGFSTEEFEKAFCGIGECKQANGIWTSLFGNGSWAFCCSYSRYRIPKDKVPDMPEIVIPDCPHCGGKGEVQRFDEDKSLMYFWKCGDDFRDANCCIELPAGNTPREAIALFHKLIKEK